ncbi:acyl carrier protein [Streptomyces sp. NPDC050674]|uniref:acyl carrier protein n=1 Tax=Streptomyces sp. NPDC050674 TaxID=3157216 RepID=UPI003423F720
MGPQTLVLAPGVRDGEDGRSGATVVGYEGSLSGSEGDASVGDVLFLQIQDYGVSPYMSLLGTTLVRMAGDTDFEMFLADADAAKAEGRFAPFAVSPAVQIPDHPDVTRVGLHGRFALRTRTRDGRSCPRSRSSPPRAIRRSWSAGCCPGAGSTFCSRWRPTGAARPCTGARLRNRFQAGFASSEDIESRIVETLCSILDAEPEDFITETRVVAHDKWDSLNSLETMVAIESAFRVRLDLRDYHATRTVGDLVELVAGGSGHA